MTLIATPMLPVKLQSSNILYEGPHVGMCLNDVIFVATITNKFKQDFLFLVRGYAVAQICELLEVLAVSYYGYKRTTEKESQGI